MRVVISFIYSQPYYHTNKYPKIIKWFSMRYYPKQKMVLWSHAGQFKLAPLPITIPGSYIHFLSYQTVEDLFFFFLCAKTYEWHRIGQQLLCSRVTPILSVNILFFPWCPFHNLTCYMTFIQSSINTIEIKKKKKILMVGNNIDLLVIGFYCPIVHTITGIY